MCVKKIFLADEYDFLGVLFFYTVLLFFFFFVAFIYDHRSHCCCRFFYCSFLFCFFSIFFQLRKLNFSIATAQTLVSKIQLLLSSSSSLHSRCYLCCCHCKWRSVVRFSIKFQKSFKLSLILFFGQQKIKRFILQQ